MSVKELVQTLNKTFRNREKLRRFLLSDIFALAVRERKLDSRFSVCAQNSCRSGSVDPEHHYDSTTGAFTGEISAEMLEDLEVPFVLLGHSERRTLLGETDEIVGKKVAHARYHGLSVVVCIGESLEERENGTTFDVIFKQLKAVAKEIDDREHSVGGRLWLSHTNRFGDWYRESCDTGASARGALENPQLVGGECQRGRCESDENSIRRPERIELRDLPS